MDNKKMGQFISELRKSKQMTQKDLATKLNITDKAVSKWERGLSYPDISLLPLIADVLGVTAGELLDGEKNNPCSEIAKTSIDNALHYADTTVKNKVKSLHEICAITFSLLLLLGIIVCAICDMAICGSFTWSLYPISSIIFAWLVFFPTIKFGKKGITATMIALSVFIIPFLYVLDNLITVSDLILPVGIRMAIISIAFLWVIFAIFKMMKTKKLFATVICLLLAIPVHILINYILSKLIHTPLIDIWDIVDMSIIAIVAIVLFILNFRHAKKDSF